MSFEKWTQMLDVAYRTLDTGLNDALTGAKVRADIEYRSSPGLIKYPDLELRIEFLRCLLSRAVEVSAEIHPDDLQAKHSVIRGALYRLRSEHPLVYDHLKLAIEEIELHLPKKDEDAE